MKIKITSNQNIEKEVTSEDHAVQAPSFGASALIVKFKCGSDRCCCVYSNAGTSLNRRAGGRTHLQFTTVRVDQGKYTV